MESHCRFLVDERSKSGGILSKAKDYRKCFLLLEQKIFGKEGEVFQIKNPIHLDQRNTSIRRNNNSKGRCFIQGENLPNNDFLRRSDGGAFMKDVSNFSKVLLATRPVDFRKHANDLSTVVKETLESQPFDPKLLFVFVNKRKTAIRMLYWDLTGFATWNKQLEKISLSGRKIRMKQKCCTQFT